MRFLIVTGLSGAGKTQAMRALEDLGYFCVDNLPPVLMPKFAELVAHAENKIEKVALVVDVRGQKFFQDLDWALGELTKLGIKYEILFLEARDEVLLKRFKANRRGHPLGVRGSQILDNIKKERKFLENLRARADKVIDTSDLQPADLRNEILNYYGEEQKRSKISINIVTFGYKYGLPLDADLIMDVRFLPNPFYVNELRPLSGSDKPVYDYVFNYEVTKKFTEKFLDLIEFLMPFYQKEGKSNLVIAIGCTGGRHRSVAIANFLARTLEEKNYEVYLRHRDLEKHREE